MPDADYELTKTSDGCWDVVSAASTVVVGTITKHGAEFDLRDAQNLSLGSHATLDDALQAIAGG